MLGGYLFDSTAQEMISTHNYFIFSTGSIGYDDESHLASIGILGHVFSSFFDKNDLNNIIDQFITFFTPQSNENSPGIFSGLFLFDYLTYKHITI